MTESSQTKKARKAAEAALANSTIMTIADQKEVWSEYDLQDGAKMRIKPVVMDIKKSNKKDAEGNFIYHVRANIIIDVQQAQKGKKSGSI